MANTNRLFLILNFSLFGFIFWHLARQMLQIRPDGWYVGQVNLYGDLVFHLGFINKFLESNKILVESPVFPAAKPNYPIFADFISAQVARFVGVDFALFIITFLAGLLVLFTARLFIRNFIKNEKIIFLSLLLFFVNGGFGFVYFFQDYLTSGNSFFEFLTHMPREYTDIKDKGFWWINNYLAYFLPQRGFLFAFPITLMVLSLLYTGIKKGKKYFFVLAGILSGILPLVQAHSLFVIFLVSSFFSISTVITAKSKKALGTNWLIFAMVTAVIALPIFNSISDSTGVLSHIRFDSGWTNEENIIWFWLKNLGFFAPILLLALFWLYKKNRHLFTLYIPFLLIFFLCNIFVFQPWEFDNSKLLLYWYFASTIVVAYFLYDQFFQESLPKKVIATIAVFFMIFAGSLDLFRTFTKVSSHRIFSSSDLELAASVKSLTPKDTLFVTADNHNHPIPSLTGRSTLLGFHGWIWSHGLDYTQREADIIKIYLGGEEAEELIKKYKINYVTIGPYERSAFSLNFSYFGKYPKIILGNDWQIYDVSNLWSDGNR